MTARERGRRGLEILNQLQGSRKTELTVHDSTSEDVDLHLVKEGRESHQAVGYLPDGTMIVVNDARAHVGKTRTVVVASALQTTAGRLIFAELKTAPRKRWFRANRFEGLSQVHFALRHCRSCEESAKAARHRPTAFAA